MATECDNLILDLASDDELKRRFIREPAVVLRERGIATPDGVELRVVEDTATLRHIVLPHLEAGAVHTVEEVEQRHSKTILLSP